MGKGQINFPAYCRAIEAFNDVQRLCGLLDPGRDAYTVDVMNQGTAGDGVISVPEYGIARGEVRLIGLRLLTEDGKVIRQTGDNKTEFGTVNSEIAQYFIAGAFGADELKGPSSLDRALLDSLPRLYGLCAENWQTCLNSAEANSVRSAWDRLKAERAAREEEKRRLAEGRRLLENLRIEYGILATKVETKSELEYKVVPYAKDMPAVPATLTEIETTAQNLRKMIETAKSILAEEGARRESENRRVKLASFRSAIPAMRQKISTAEGVWYSRFTDAYDAGMACMPRPSTPEEEYCVARNTFKMGEDILWKAENFPKRTICDKTETTMHSTGGRDPDIVERTRCISSHTTGEDYSADELLQSARGYCSAACQ